MNFTQPTLENENALLQPLKETDFEALYKVASDPKIWEQHPNPDRYRRDVFQTFFQGAMSSGGAFLIVDKASGTIAGTTRFYNWDRDESSIFIGYTFFGTQFWGSKLNPPVKSMMLDYIFDYVDVVKFHIGAENWRSRKSIERLGAELIGEVIVAYHGEAERENVEYGINKENWLNKM